LFWQLINSFLDSLFQIFYFLFKDSPSTGGVELKSKVAFDEIVKRTGADPKLLTKINAIIVIEVTKDGKIEQTWSMFVNFWKHNDDKIDWILLLPHSLLPPQSCLKYSVMQMKTKQKLNFRPYATSQKYFF